MEQAWVDADLLSVKYGPEDGSWFLAKKIGFPLYGFVIDFVLFAKVCLDISGGSFKINLSEQQELHPVSQK